MKTNLIIVEGLPGSGKSTTAALIADALQKKGRKVICVDEGAADHPADFADYDFPDFETERQHILEKWRSFAEHAQKDTIYVFNCVFLQNPMCETMMRFGMDETASRRYISEIAGIIKPLQPVILYIDLPDVKAASDRVLKERGNGWLKAVVDYHTLQGYGKEHHLSGCAGYIQCLEERKDRERRIMQTLDIKYFTIQWKMNGTELAEWFDSAGEAAP